LSALRNLSGKYSKPERPVKNKDGQPISDLEGKKKRWVENFEELLNRSAPPDPPDIQPADSDRPIDCSAPTKEEIQNAIKQLRNGKAAGPDNIPAEALKVDIMTNVSCSTLFSISSGKRSGYQQSGRRVTSSSSPKKVISAPAPITEV